MRAWFRRRTWVVEAPRLEETPQGHRVVARVGPQPVGFTSDDAPLRPAVEAFAGLLLLPALKRGATVRIEAPVDARWLAGARELARIYADWWGGTEAFPLVPAAVREETTRAPRRRALCFTAGVDSFFELLRRDSRYDDLVYVVGYDMPLSDRRRRDALLPALREIGDAFGKEVVVLASDVRAHPTFRSVSWERTHGAALAAAGHVLGDRIGRLTTGPSWMHGNLRPWGTHPTTDPLWSSGRLAIEAGEAILNRHERIRAIARHPLVQRHLRVCWEHRTPGANCSRCEKCIRTMVVLEGLGLRERFATFELHVDLAAAVDGLPGHPAGYRSVWGPVVDLDLPRPLRAAVERLLARSG